MDCRIEKLWGATANALNSSAPFLAVAVSYAALDWLVVVQNHAAAVGYAAVVVPEVVQDHSAAVGYAADDLPDPVAVG